MNERLRVSVIIPSKKGEYLEYTLKSLANQTVKPDEVVLVLKDCNIKKIEKFCNTLGLNYIIEEQKKGYFTHALNIGKKIASGDVIIFTDDDVILPENWIKNYIKLFRNSNSKIGSFSSRDIYYDLKTKRVIKSSDDKFHIKLFRSFIRPILDPPLSVLEKYKFGSYISRKFRFVFGKSIPNKQCYSLPFRGVNMAFRKEAIEDIWFIEHPKLKRGFRNEQHFGLQLILKGYDSIYIPNNPIYHIVRESLSRGVNTEILRREEEIVREDIKKMLEKV